MDNSPSSRKESDVTEATNIYHILGLKTRLNKLKKIKIISSFFFSNLKGMKLKSTTERKTEKNKHVETTQHATKKKG